MPEYPVYTVSKTYGHERGLSCCFRQWRAKSHCKFLHGYAIAVKLTVTAAQLDDRNWAFDFGDFKEIKQFLEDTFDHKTLVAQDDPNMDDICALAGLMAADVLVLPNVGCEAFAKYVFDFAKDIIDLKSNSRAHLTEVAIMEHGSNTATYKINQ